MSSHVADDAAVRDPRDEAYARLLVGKCIVVRPAWQGRVVGTPLTRPLLEEGCRELGRRGAHVIVRLQLRYAEGLAGEAAWRAESPEELLSEMPGIPRHEYDEMN